MNRNAKLAISPGVLKVFRDLTEETVVWDRDLKVWRPRVPSDPAGREGVRWDRQFAGKLVSPEQAAALEAMLEIRPVSDHTGRSVVAGSL